MRLRSRAEFAAVRQSGRSAQGRLIKVAVLFSNAGGEARLGLITSKRAGGAVERNRIRRRLREIFRNQVPRPAAGAWIVVIAKAQAATVSSAELREEWLRLATKLSIVPQLE